MLRTQWMTTASGLLLGIAFAAGCNPDAGGPPAPPSNNDGGHAEHAHPSEGPHGGELVALGNEEYHAELIHDDNAGTLTIYILDAHGETAVPVDATELTINLKHDGQAEQFTLSASPDANDPQGKSSRFTSNDAELGADIEHEGAEPQLVIAIDGKQYRGMIVHADHGREGGHKH